MKNKTLISFLVIFMMSVALVSNSWANPCEDLFVGEPHESETLDRQSNILAHLILTHVGANGGLWPEDIQHIIIDHVGIFHLNLGKLANALDRDCFRMQRLQSSGELSENKLIPIIKNLLQDVKNPQPPSSPASCAVCGSSERHWKHVEAQLEELSIQLIRENNRHLRLMLFRTKSEYLATLLKKLVHARAYRAYDDPVDVQVIHGLLNRIEWLHLLDKDKFDPALQKLATSIHRLWKDSWVSFNGSARAVYQDQRRFSVKVLMEPVTLFLTEAANAYFLRPANYINPQWFFPVNSEYLLAHLREENEVLRGMLLEAQSRLLSTQLVEHIFKRGNFKKGSIREWLERDKWFDLLDETNLNAALTKLVESLHRYWQQNWRRIHPYMAFTHEEIIPYVRTFLEEAGYHD